MKTCKVCGKEIIASREKCPACSRAYRLFHSNHKTEDETVEIHKWIIDHFHSGEWTAKDEADVRAAYRAGETE